MRDHDLALTRIVEKLLAPYVSTEDICKLFRVAIDKHYPAH